MKQNAPIFPRNVARGEAEGAKQQTERTESEHGASASPTAARAQEFDALGWFADYWLEHDELGRKASLSRRSGDEVRACCPFHDDNSPSFSINVAKSGYPAKCHAGSCGWAGNAVTLLEQAGGISREEARRRVVACGGAAPTGRRRREYTPKHGGDPSVGGRPKGPAWFRRQKQRLLVCSLLADGPRPRADLVREIMREAATDGNPDLLPTARSSANDLLTRLLDDGVIEKSENGLREILDSDAHPTTSSDSTHNNASGHARTSQNEGKKETRKEGPSSSQYRKPDNKAEDKVAPTFGDQDFVGASVVLCEWCGRPVTDRKRRVWRGRPVRNPRCSNKCKEAQAEATTYHAYRDADGRVLARLARIPKPHGESERRFSWEQPVWIDDAHPLFLLAFYDEAEADPFDPYCFPDEVEYVRSWVWGRSGVKRVLYNLPEVVHSSVLATVYICEGEKDCDSARRAWGIITTTNPDGAATIRRSSGSGNIIVSGVDAEMAEWLRRRRVVIVRDNDDAGKNHAEALKYRLRGVAASVDVVRPAVGKDVSDHIEAGFALEDLIPDGR